MVNLWLAVGIPGSGKSTYIRKEIRNKNGIRISRDVIRFALIEDNEDYFAKEKLVFKEFINQIQNAINSKILNIYVDATHLNEKSRNKILDKLNLDNVQIHILYFDIPLNICLARNSLRTGREKVPEDTIVEMYSKLTKPDFHEKYTYSTINIVDENNKITYIEGIMNEKIIKNKEIKNIFIERI